MDELCGVCAILRIPFVVIVQPHLLKDKGSVRLRQVESSSGGHEIFVPLQSLTATIRELSSDSVDDDAPTRPDLDGMGTSNQAFNMRAENGTTPSRTSADKSLECIYVESDQYFGYDRGVSKSEASNWKVVLKGLKGVRQRCEGYISQLKDPGTKGIPVFSVNLSFLVVREFGTCLMRREHERSALGASAEITERYPNHKRDLKTLAIAIDNFMKRSGVWGSTSREGKREVSKNLLFMLLYSRIDDRFDVVTCSSDVVETGGADVVQSKYGRKGDNKR